MSTEFQFELSKPLSYAHKGEQKETEFITLYEPSYENMENCVWLKQAFLKAATAIADSQTADESSEASASDLTGDNIIAMFYQSDEDMFKVILHGVELLKMKGIALLGGQEKLTTPLISKISNIDIENMIGDYMVNFILASVLDKA